MQPSQTSTPEIDPRTQTYIAHVPELEVSSCGAPGSRQTIAGRKARAALARAIGA